MEFSSYVCCHSATVDDYCSGDRICTQCGTVLESHAFQVDGTFEVAPSNEIFDSFDERTMNRLRRIDDLIAQLAGSMHLCDGVVRVAMRLMMDAFRAGFRPRDSIVRVAAASAIYYACRVYEVDRAEVEISANCDVSSKQLTITNKHFRRKLMMSSFASKIYAPANPVKLIPRFLDVLCVTPPLIREVEKANIRTKAERIGTRAIEHGTLEGKSPECCCVAFLFLAVVELGYPQSILHDLCERCGITRSTVQNALFILSP